VRLGNESTIKMGIAYRVDEPTLNTGKVSRGEGGQKTIVKNRGGLGGFCGFGENVLEKGDVPAMGSRYWRHVGHVLSGQLKGVGRARKWTLIKLAGDLRDDRKERGDQQAQA